ncbi:hypothetical protein PM082_019322 [Marasmius tenuissimus]|nr:hypothetical protein PM082_019322 [Marasmius tenuissimus]
MDRREASTHLRRPPQLAAAERIITAELKLWQYHARDTLALVMQRLGFALAISARAADSAGFAELPKFELNKDFHKFFKASSGFVLLAELSGP